MGMIIVRGGGDLATGTIYKLHQCGYAVLVLETARPSLTAEGSRSAKQSTTAFPRWKAPSAAGRRQKSSA